MTEITKKAPSALTLADLQTLQRRGRLHRSEMLRAAVKGLVEREPAEQAVPAGAAPARCA
ncbi:MAG: hypothetical protein AAFR04_12150 [Pseudomonadota bacterium]